MSATTQALSYNPVLRLSSPCESHRLKLNPTRKPISIHQFLTTNSVSAIGSVPRRLMTELVPSSAFRVNNGGDEALEQDAFISGSSSFLPQEHQSILNKSSKWLVPVLFIAVVIWRHDAEALWGAMGCVLNNVLAIALKRIINQERPFPEVDSGPGMPSSHAQSIFFIVVFAIISVVQWLGINVFTVIISGLALAFSSYLSWLRVSQQHHTIRQVVVGAVLGSVFSVSWFWSWKAFVYKAFISSILVRIMIILGTVGFCISFLLYFILYCLTDSSKHIDYSS